MLLRRIVRKIIVTWKKGRTLRQYIVSDTKKFVYIVVPKTGCSSIKYTFANEDVETDEPIHKYVTKKMKRYSLSEEQKAYPTFAFVRNPFDRIVSCYVHKIQMSEHRLRGWYVPGIHIKREETFESFVRKVCRIPDLFSDWHFQSQYPLLYKRGKKLYTILGKFETLEEDFVPIQKQFGLRELPHIHKTKKGDWRSYYTRELADLVYKRYKKDITLFGYEHAYQELLCYLREKNR